MVSAQMDSCGRVAATSWLAGLLGDAGVLGEATPALVVRPAGLTRFSRSALAVRSRWLGSDAGLPVVGMRLTGCGVDQEIAT